MSKEILSTNGEKLGEITLNEQVFGVEPNLHVMHLALRRQLNNARQGSACAKTRAEVSGGGKKPWKQKGTGRARQGSIRAPQWIKGGVVFAPKPRDFSQKINQKMKVAALKSGECVLLENLRFHAEEEGRDENFCKQLAEYCDIYVNDAFGTAHRSHASTAGIAEYGFVKECVCGFLIEKELNVMAKSLEAPVRPFVAVLGGAKVADKLKVIDNLLEKCDTLIIGGGMAYTFIKAQGGNVGNSLVDDEKIDYCK